MVPRGFDISGVPYHNDDSVNSCIQIDDSVNSCIRIEVYDL